MRMTLTPLTLNKFDIFEKWLNKWILQETFQQFVKRDDQNRVRQILVDQPLFVYPPTFSSISILSIWKHFNLKIRFWNIPEIDSF